MAGYIALLIVYGILFIYGMYKVHKINKKSTKMAKDSIELARKK